ncbi:sigma 54-interacting transcriptional regulator [Pseudomonas sp. B6002]|uniref:sigma-54 interaction domain-containing protein n=1 Tax=Pseudomonas sp. B6002 TaxID=2726978 RepID=UPI0015A41F79|nr:sigma 54-interacting transcriptional regulator [Pseudomonas sp. B6002]NVZ50489.1 sigma 54-interacting transcriptional regulator [Pseudomonas sp. B6002]
MTNNLLDQLPQPLVYAERLLGWYTRLGADEDASSLLELCVAAVAQLSDCELCQLYERDETTGRLGLIAQHIPGSSPTQAGEDFQNEQLLHYVVNQRCALNLDELCGSVYDSGFLPAASTPWRSLACLPLFNRNKAICGVLLYASQRAMPLQGFAASLGQLGSFVLNQWGSRIARPGQAAMVHKRDTSLRGAYGLIGNSTAMDETCRLMGKVLLTPYTVLLRGETGTGKEVVARAIHRAGPRGAQPFVVQNCAAFPEGLLESELFGYRKGAFTGAERNYAGLFDAAHGGTLLLDEIGDMPLSLQAKLLRVLQEGEIRPLGASTAHKVDVRIIAATHRDLAAMVAEGSFREDLYYRLAQFPIELPALRDRDGDVLLLARHFAEQACSSLEKPPVSWSSAALDQLSSHGFPGNVRELKCLVERAVLLCDDGVILPEHLSLSPAPAIAAVESTLRQRLERVERVFLIDCLHKNRGNRTRTARELGVARRTLLYRLARLNIPFGDARGNAE